MLLSWNRHMEEFLSPYRHVRKSLAIYWSSYGGWSALLHSPYFHISILISLICYPAWIEEQKDWVWYNICLSVIPNLLGFTLGGYAMLLAFGNESFCALLADDDGDGKPSPFLAVNATFIHFILIQVLALVIAVLGLVWSINVGIVAFLGFTVILYALSTAAAAALAILRLAGWFNSFIKKSRDKTRDG